MKKIPNNYVPYNQSIQLKIIGFDEPCRGCHTNIDKNVIFEFLKKPTMYSEIFQAKSKHCMAPTYSEAFDFFRTVYNLDTFVYPLWDDDNVKTYVFCYGNADLQMSYDEIEYQTHREAELNCLIKLISIVQNIKQ